MLKAALFDIGGVLEDTPERGWFGRWDPTNLMEDVWTTGALGHLSEAEVERQLALRLNLDPSRLQTAQEEMWAAYLGQPFQEVIDYFASLRPRYRTGLLSNSFVGAREREEARYGFPALCDDLVYSHEVGLLKPDPRIYRLSCERLGVAPEAAVFVDDVEVNVQAARDCGMVGVLFREPAQALAELRQLLA